MYLLLIGNLNAIVHCQNDFVSFLNLKHNIMMNQILDNISKRNAI